MNKLWLIAFLILPIIGITYATWRTWHILPLKSNGGECNRLITNKKQNI